jgi:hypothetical protein
MNQQNALYSYFNVVFVFVSPYTSFELKFHLHGVSILSKTTKASAVYTCVHRLYITIVVWMSI